MSILDRLKQTGRTTRMMQDAMHYVTEGKTVYVLALSSDHVSILRRAYPIPGVVFHTPETIQRLKPQILKKPTNSILLTDHAVLEKELAPALEMLHRYDPPELA